MPTLAGRSDQLARCRSPARGRSAARRAASRRARTSTRGSGTGSSRVSPQPSVSTAPRWRQTLRNARSSPSRSRVTRIGMPPASVVRNEPGPATCSARPAYCQARAKIASALAAQLLLVGVPGERKGVRLGHSRFASMMRCRNCCVRASRGELKISLGRPLLEDAAVVEKTDAGRRCRARTTSRGWRSPSSCRRRRARRSPRAPPRRAPGRARSSPRRTASAPAASRALARSRRAAAARRRDDRDTPPRFSASPNRSSSAVARSSASRFERPSTSLWSERHVAQHAHVREEIERLEDDPDPAAHGVHVVTRA